MRDSSSRHPGLDLARNLAVLLVIVQHLVFLGGLSNDGMGSLHKFQARLLEAASQSCVDLFGLLSGYLGVATLGWKWRKFGKLWLQVWSTGILLLGGCTAVGWLCPNAFAGHLPTRADWLTAAFPLLCDEYWYFTGYLFVFLFAPPLNRCLFAEGRERRGLAVAAVLYTLLAAAIHFTLIGTPACGWARLFTGAHYKTDDVELAFWACALGFLLHLSLGAPVALRAYRRGYEKRLVATDV